MICDGMSWEEVERREEMIFSVYGWLLRSVEPEPEWGLLGWHYTIGLSESFGVPDLLLVGEPDFLLGARAVRFVAESVVDHGWDLQEVAAVHDLGLRPIDTTHMPEDTLADWIIRYQRVPEPHEMMHLVLPPAMPDHLRRAA